MSNVLKFSPEALSDLDKIYNYIFDKLKNPVAANNTVDGILNTAQNLILFPNSGTRFCLPNGEETIFRFTMFNNYLTFYHVQNEYIYVDRVLYGGCNYIKILFGNNRNFNEL